MFNIVSATLEKEKTMDFSITTLPTVGQAILGLIILAVGAGLIGVAYLAVKFYTQAAIELVAFTRRSPKVALRRLGILGLVVAGLSTVYLGAGYVGRASQKPVLVLMCHNVFGTPHETCVRKVNETLGK